MVDFKGQELAENIYAFIVIFCGVLSWCVGYYQGSFKITVQGWAIGLGLSLVVSCA